MDKETNYPTPFEKDALLRLARNSINSLFTGIKTIDNTVYNEWLSSNRGAFVSIHTQTGELRGCLGRFISDIPLFMLVKELAVSAARNDYRFPPVKEVELGNLIIEISVLSPLRRIHSISEIERGIHGIYIKRGKNTGTFLPQVILETNWDIETFVSRCSGDKAWIGPDGWKSAELYVYTADVFRENYLNIGIAH